MKRFLLAALFAICGQAKAESILLPPAPYDHVPDFMFEVITHDENGEALTWWNIRDYCRRRGGKELGDYNGCESKNAHWEALPLLDPSLPSELKEDMVRHSNGHMNGWPADHPDAHY